MAPLNETSVASPPRGEVVSIQVLRGLAAFGVLIFHAAERAGGSFGVGAAGVDVFFVISGFIMWVVTANRPTTPGRFLLRRLWRVAPLYWLITLLMAGAAVAIPGSFPQLQPTWARLGQSLAFWPHRDGLGLIAPILVPGWTLNYEMFFYLVFAGGLLAPARLRIWVVSAALAALVAVGVGLDRSDAVMATYTDPLLLEFVGGLWLGRAWMAGRVPGRAISASLLIGGVLALTAGALSGVDVAPGRIVIWGLPALAIVTGAVGLEQAGHRLDWPPLRRLGDASYSLYLVHGLAISVVVRVLSAAGLSSSPLILAGGLAGGLAAGFVVYRLIERPLSRVRV